MPFVQILLRRTSFTPNTLSEIARNLKAIEVENYEK